jgi:adenylate cyclase class IV
MIGPTRVHLDEVEGLGCFMELEVQMKDGQSDAQGQAIAEDLMRRLDVRPENLIEGAYMDMLEAR